MGLGALDFGVSVKSFQVEGSELRVLPLGFRVRRLIYKKPEAPERGSVRYSRVLIFNALVVEYQCSGNCFYFSEYCSYHLQTHHGPTTYQPPPIPNHQVPLKTRKSPCKCLKTWYFLSSEIRLQTTITYWCLVGNKET